MKIIKKVLSIFMLGAFGFINLYPNFVNGQQTSPYDSVLGITTSDTSLSSAIKGKEEIVTEGTGAELFNAQVFKIISYIIDIFIVIGIAVAFIGGYKIMTSDKDESMKEGIRLVIFGIVGIIIMVSAGFLASSLVGENGIIREEFVPIKESDTPNGIKFADNLYQKIMFPFIKFILYFVVGILFFMMLGKVIGFVTATDDSAKKKAGGIIIRCVIGILIIMGSKQIVEAVMGKQSEVLNKSAQRISGGSNDGGMGEEILEFESMPIIAQIINWVMGLTIFIIVILIIIQGYKFFTKPDDPKNLESLKKTILYIFIGILVIGAAYVISNALVINNLPITTS